MTVDELFEKIKDEVQDDSQKRRIEIAEEVASIILCLSNERIKTGLSQRDLAEKCGMKQSAIARIERLQVIPRLDTLIKIANCLKLVVSIEQKKTVQLMGQCIEISDYTTQDKYRLQTDFLNSNSQFIGKVVNYAAVS